MTTTRMQMTNADATQSTIIAVWYAVTIDTVDWDTISRCSRAMTWSDMSMSPLTLSDRWWLKREEVMSATRPSAPTVSLCARTWNSDSYQNLNMQEDVHYEEICNFIPSLIFYTKLSTLNYCSVCCKFKELQERRPFLSRWVSYGLVSGAGFQLTPIVCFYSLSLPAPPDGMRRPLYCCQWPQKWHRWHLDMFWPPSNCCEALPLAFLGYSSLHPEVCRWYIYHAADHGTPAAHQQHQLVLALCKQQSTICSIRLQIRVFNSLARVQNW